MVPAGRSNPIEVTLPITIGTKPLASVIPLGVDSKYLKFVDLHKFFLSEEVQRECNLMRILLWELNCFFHERVSSLLSPGVQAV